MKTLVTATAIVALMALSAPAIAHLDNTTVSSGVPGAPDILPAPDDIAKRGRGGRSKPRIPGGSGCDDPGDVAEHPECAG